MNTKRMKFAVVRGAQLQFCYDSDKPDAWMTMPHGSMPFRNGCGHYRIHPDHEYLQYGPLSMICLHIGTSCDPKGAVAAIPGAKHDPYTDAVIALAESTLVAHNSEFAMHEEWCMYFLFLAEMLADEGL